MPRRNPTPTAAMRVRDWYHGKKMPDSMKLRLMALGTAVSHDGSVLYPVEAWEIDRERSRELKSDGSNFFDVATLVWRHR